MYMQIFGRTFYVSVTKFIQTRQTLAVTVFIFVICAMVALVVMVVRALLAQHTRYHDPRKTHAFS